MGATLDTTAHQVDAPVRNVIFDMGGVLLRFDGLLFSRFYTSSEEDAAALNAALFSSSAWPLLDAGVISEPTIERMAQARLPERLWTNLHEALGHWQEHQPAIVETNEVVGRLHAAGYGCYLLSNAGLRFWRAKERIPSFPVMDGWVVSAFEHLMKPDPAIYLLLCERYGLDPAGCVFVDDNADNTRGAEAAGMHAHLFQGAAGLVGYLEDLGMNF
jgi:HAD superfamily hydrolase (TIGR01509 family)